MPVRHRPNFPAHAMPSSFVLKPLRAAAIACVLGIAPLQTSWAQPAVEATRIQFDIPAGPLDAALNRFGRQTGALLSVDAALTKNKTSPGVRGEQSADVALQQLLEGTGLGAVRADDGSYSLRQLPAGDETTLKAVRVRAAAESPTAPIAGYRATRALSGTRTDTPIRDIPQTINVVTRDELQDRGVTRITDVFYTVPGAHGGTGYGGLANGYGTLLRGFSSYTDYRDGFRDFGFVSPRDVALFERIEVAKGPSSVLYGTNDPGGAVNYVTKRPLFDAERKATLTYGSYDSYRATVDLGGPLIDSGNLAYRLVAVYDDRGSHRDYVESETRILAPSLALRVGDDTLLTLLTEFTRYDYTFERGFPTEPEFIDLPRDRFLEEPDLNGAETRSRRYTLELTHSFNAAWQLRGALSYLKPSIEKTNLYPGGLDADRRALDRSVDHSDEYQLDRTLQLELTGNITTGSIAHTLLTGFEHYRNNFRYTFSPFNVSSPIDIYQPVYGQVVIPPGFYDEVAFGNNYGSRTSAVYVQDQLTFTPEWKMTLGVRYDHARLFNDDLTDPSLSMDKQTQSRASPRAGIVYQPSPATALFLSYSTSFKPQIFNLHADGSLPKPEIGRQVELGWRQALLDDRLQSTVSVFEIRKKNVSTSDLDNPNFTIQVGEQRSRGAEWELRGNVSSALEVIVAAAYIDAEVTRDNALPEGDQLDSAPPYSASVWAKYQPQPQGWFGGGGVFYVDEREGTLPNNGVQLPSETRLDALLGYEAQRWRVQLNLHNLTNEKLYVPYGGLFIPGPGRNAELSLQVGW